MTAERACERCDVRAGESARNDERARRGTSERRGLIRKRGRARARARARLPHTADAMDAGRPRVSVGLVPLRRIRADDALVGVRQLVRRARDAARASELERDRPSFEEPERRVRAPPVADREAPAARRVAYADRRIGPARESPGRATQSLRARDTPHSKSGV